MKPLVVHVCVEEGSYPAEVVAHPLAELAGLAILSGDHSSIPAPAPRSSPEELTETHSWTTVLCLMDHWPISHGSGSSCDAVRVEKESAWGRKSW